MGGIMLCVLRSDFWKQLCSGFLIAALTVVQVYAGLPMVTYEAPAYTSGISISSYSGWQVQDGQATVVDSEAFDSSQALKLHKGTGQNVQVTRDLSIPAGENIAFIDFRIKPVAVPNNGTATSTIEVNGTHLSFVKDPESGTGVLYVLDGNDDRSGQEEWVDTAHRQALAGALSHETQDWIRVTIRQDYAEKVWDLYVDDVLYAADMGFYQRGSTLQNIRFYGNQVGDVYLDDLQSDESNMLFTDADKDGIPDDFENANGMNTSLNDRDVVNSTGKTNLGSYLESLFPWYSAPGGQSSQTPGGGTGAATIPPITILSGHQVVGSVGGSFEVGGNGAASYSVPLDLPAGTGGMVPQLALAYSSGGGNGIMGVGWDMSGLQRITRGPATRARDGFIDAVDFDDKDRFYLDGERLVAVKNASGQAATTADYGKAGTEYRTENNSFARIISHGQLGSGPHHWTVETKAGLMLEFGNCGTSCVQNPSGEGALVWSLNKAQDSVGNYYQVVYEQDGSAPNESIDYRPQEIRYTGNTGAGLAPFSLVKFVYETRPDVSSGYIAGIKVHSQKRLSSVEIRYAAGGSGNGSLLYKYDLRYCDEDTVTYPGGWAEFAAKSQTRRSMLDQVTKVASDNTALPPTKIVWGPRQTAAAPKKWGSSTEDNQNRPVWSGTESDFSIFLDVNGDGLPDRVDHWDQATNDFAVWVSLNDGGKFLSKSKWQDMAEEGQNYAKWADNSDTFSTFMDINGDGLPDRVHHRNYTTNENGIWVSLNTGSGFAAMTKWMSSSKEEQNYIEWVVDDSVLSSFVDMNGDGLPDRVDHKNYTTNEFGVWVRLNTGSGFASAVKWLVAPDRERSAQTYADGQLTYNSLLDINGDGLPDKVEHKNYSTGNYGLWVRLNTGSGFGPLQDWGSMPQQQQNYVSWGDNSDVQSMFIDINADGLPDRVHHMNYATNQPGLWVALNTGKGFEPLVKWLTTTDPDQSLPSGGYNDDTQSMFQDVNGDGLPDRVDHINYDLNNDHAIWVRINTGSGFLPQQKWLESRDEGQTNPVWRYDTDTLAMFIDMNGDGLVDRVTHRDFENNEGGIFVHLNTGNSFGYSFHRRWHVSTHQQQNYVTWRDDGNTYSDFIDMNGDGLLDRVDHYNYTTSDDGIWVSLNTGNGYASATKWLDSSQAEQNYLFWNDNAGGVIYSRFIDMNGDGKPDRVDHYNYATNDDGLWVRLNTGCGFGAASKWLDMPTQAQNYPRWGTDSDEVYSDLVDVNGDGKPDRVDHYNYETSEPGLWVRLNTGTGFGTRTRWLNTSQAEQSYPTWRQNGDILSGFMDMDGDGKLDRVDHHKYSTNDDGLYVRLNTGTGFAAPVEWLDMPTEEQNYPFWNDHNYESVYSCLVDMNGDGKPDRVDHYNYATNDHGIWVALNTGSGFGARSKWLDATDEQGSCATYKNNGNIYSDLRDMNGDGLPDRVTHYDAATDDHAIWVRLNTGSGFGAKFKWLDVRESEQNQVSNQQGDFGSVYNSLVDIDGDGLLDHVMHYDHETGQYGLWVELNEVDGFQVAANPPAHERVCGITDGFGAEIKIEYTRVNDPSLVQNSTDPVYQKGNVATMPAGHIAIQDSRWVVSRYAEQDGMGGWRYKRHHYGDLRYDRDEEIPLGFRWINVIDEQRGHASYTEYSQSFPMHGTVTLSESSIADGTVISRNTGTYSQMPVVNGAGGTVYYPYQSAATGQKFDIDGTHLSTSTTSQTVDAYGSVLNSTVTLTDHINSKVWTTTTANTYQNTITASKWHLARLLDATVTKTGTGQAPQTKTTAFTYDSATGLLATETVQPGHSKSVSTSRSRDAFGNVISTTTSAAGVPNRTSSSVYDAYGRFVIQTTNVLGHAASMVYDQEKALLLESTDANGLRTSFTYDVFGTKILTTHPNGTQTAEITKLYTGSVFAGISFVRKTETSGTPAATVYLDAQGRERITESVAFDGQTVRTETEYDVLGRKHRVSLPYFAGDTPAGWKSVTYDEVDRVTRTDHPDGTCDCATYDDFTTVMTNRNGQVRTRVQNARQELVSVKDHNNVTSTFEYFVSVL